MAEKDNQNVPDENEQDRAAQTDETERATEERGKTVTSITDRQIDEQAKSMEKILAKQKKVRIRIPKLGKQGKPDPQDDIPIPVTVNGYTYPPIRRGVTVEVPQTVADILEESGYLG